MFDAYQIQKEITNVGKGMKGLIIQNYAEQFGISTASIYRKLRKEFGRKKEVHRENRIPDNLIDEVAKLKMKGLELGMQEREMATEICIMILQSKAMQGSELLTTSTVNRRLRLKGFRQKDAIVRVEPEYANQQHQLDFSRSKYFNLHKKTEDGDFILRVSKVLSYKESEKKLRLWMGGLMDAYSRLALVKAFPATGESTVLGLELLRWAYNRPEDDLPLRYLPETLKYDNGVLDNKSTDALLKKLEIKKELVIPYKKRGIQKMESVWKLVWKRFELPLAIKLGANATIHLQDYNELLHQFMIENAEAEHPRRGLTKLHAYNSTLHLKTARKLENDVSEYLFRTWKRKVKQDLTASISYKGEKVLLEAPLFALDKWINVYINYAGDFVGELADEYHKPFVLKITEGFITLGNFEHRQHNTYKDNLEKELKIEKKVAKINYLPVKEKTVEPETKFTEAEFDEEYSFADIFEAKAYIGNQLGFNETYSDYAEIFDDFLTKQGGLQKSEIDQVLQAIKSQKAMG